MQDDPDGRLLSLRSHSASPQSAGVAALDHQNLSHCLGQKFANPFHDTGSQHGPGRLLRTVGKPGLYLRRVQDVVEHRFTLTRKEALLNE